MEIKKTDLQIKVIQKIKELRDSQNISQAYLSDILELNSYGVIGNIESLKYSHKYTLRQLHTICKYFEFPFEELFLDKEESVNMTKSELIDCLIIKLIEYDEKG